MTELNRFQRGVGYSLTFILLLWSVEAVEQAFALDFREFGILPRTLKGTVGILTGPLVHGDIFHLISNTFPLVILGVGVFYFYNRIALEVILIIYFLTGAWVWMIARQAYHIGSSGIVYGLLAFLFFSGLFRKNVKTLAVSLLLIFIYGGNMIYGVFPVNAGISWESHLLGGFVGLFCAYYFRHVPSSVYTEPERDEIEIASEVDDAVQYHTYFKAEQQFKYKTNRQKQIRTVTKSKGGYNLKVDPKDLI